MTNHNMAVFLFHKNIEMAFKIDYNINIII